MSKMWRQVVVTLTRCIQDVRILGANISGCDSTAKNWTKTGSGP